MSVKRSHILMAISATPLSVGAAQADVSHVLLIEKTANAPITPEYVITGSTLSSQETMQLGVWKNGDPKESVATSSSSLPSLPALGLSPVKSDPRFLIENQASILPLVNPAFTIPEAEKEVPSTPPVRLDPIQVAGLSNPVLSDEERIALVTPPPEQQQVASLPANSTQGDMVFNTSFLRGGANINLDDLLSSGVLPGQYEVLVSVNGQPILTTVLNFEKNNRTKLVEACLSLELLAKVGVDTEKLASEKKIDPSADNGCLDLPLIMDKASQSYNSERFRLLLSIPQVYLKEAAQSYPDPSTWDYGVNAFVTQYSSSFSQSWDHDGGKSRSRFSSSLRNRLNLFGWRFYNTGSLTYSENDSFDYSSFSTYAEHDVDFLKAQFRIGDVYASAHGLDGVGIRGIQLADDLTMQPGLTQMFRPSIRGVAETSSTVEVRQQGFLILTTSVPPGPFEIRDVPNVASDGDMEITIIGADGRRLVSVQPWISGANILNPGFFTYTATMGQYKNYSSEKTSSLNVASLDYRYGVNEYLSISGGSQIANGYLANAASLATATPIGPVSIDLRHSVSDINGRRTTGGGLGFSYSKAFDPYGFTFTLASQRFTSKGFRSLTEHASLRTDPSNIDNINNVKLVSSVSINKTFQDTRWGSFYFTLSDTQYWNNANSASSLTLGYNNSFNGIYFGVSGTYTKNVASGMDAKDSKGLTFNVSIPLGSNDYPIRVNASYKTGSGFDSNQSLSKSGDFFIDTQRFNYTAYINGNHRKLDSIGANISTSSSHGNYNAALTTSSDFTNLNLGATGGVVVHGGGVNFTNNSTDTIALVQVPEQSGVQIGNTRTGFNGYAVVPVNAYQNNQILIGKDLDPNIDLIQDTGLNVVPRRDAIVKTEFGIVTGRRVEFTLSTNDEKRLPFGSILTDQSGKRIGITDPFGKALVLLPDNLTRLTADWGTNSCSFDVTLPPADPKLYFEKQAISCIPDKKD